MPWILNSKCLMRWSKANTKVSSDSPTHLREKVRKTSATCTEVFPVDELWEHCPGFICKMLEFYFLIIVFLLCKSISLNCPVLHAYNFLWVWCKYKPIICVLPSRYTLTLPYCARIPAGLLYLVPISQNHSGTQATDLSIEFQVESKQWHWVRNFFNLFLGGNTAEKLSLVWYHNTVGLSHLTNILCLQVTLPVHYFKKAFYPSALSDQKKLQKQILL